MNRHTPGPWEVSECRKVDKQYCEFQIRRAGAVGIHASAIIGWTNEGNAAEIETIEANARLIAAAPELLSALKMMLAAAKCGYDPLVALAEYGAKAEAAIAKAKGGV